MSTTSTATEAKIAAEISQMIEPWNRACLERDWDALLGMCTDDVVFMPHGEPQVEGDAVRPWLDAFPEIKAMTWSIEHLEAAGDLAVLRGPVKQTLVIDGEAQQVDAKFCDLARREGDGRWRIATVIWNANHM